MGRLLDAGMKVLADKGYHASRVDDIVNEAEVSHGTFYLYFSNKEDLLRSLAVQCSDEMAGVIDGLGEVEPGPEGVATLRSWLSLFVETYRRYGVVIRAWMEDTVADRELVRLGEETFNKATTSLVARLGAVPGSADPDLAAAALLALVERYTYFLVSRDIAVDESVLGTLSRVIHRGWFGASAAPGVRATS